MSQSKSGVENPKSLRIMSYNTHLAGKSTTTWPGLRDKLVDALGIFLEIPDVAKIAKKAIDAIKNQTSLEMMKTFHDEARRAGICQQILSMDEQPDVICFQEVWDSHYADKMIKDLKSAFPHKYHVHKSDRRSSKTIIKEMSDFIAGDNKKLYAAIYAGLELIDINPFSRVHIRKFLATSGLLIVSKYKISEKKFRSFTYGGAKYAWKEDVCASKGVAYIEIKLNSGKHPDKAHILTTHAATGALYPANRLVNVFEKTKIIRRLTKDHKNIFFCGDFNIHRFKDPNPPEEASWYQSSPPQVGGRLINNVINGLPFGKYLLIDLFKQQGLKECYTVGGSKDTLMTYFDKHKEVQPKATIDFHFSNMKIKTPGQVLRDWTFTVDNTSYSLSDHFPVISHVKVNY